MFATYTPTYQANSRTVRHTMPRTVAGRSPSPRSGTVVANIENTPSSLGSSESRLLPRRHPPARPSSSEPSIPRDNSRTGPKSESSSITMRSPQPSRCPQPVFRTSCSIRCFCLMVFRSTHSSSSSSVMSYMICSSFRQMVTSAISSARLCSESGLPRNRLLTA